MVEAERAPERIWQTQQLKLQAQAAALTQLNANLNGLESRMNDLKDFTGAFAAYTATSSDDSLVSATATSGASAGQHTIVVEQLATAASFYSNTLASGSSTITDGSLSIKVGAADAVNLTIDSTNNTLDKLAAAINAKGLNVQANVVTDAKGARLVIAGTKSGAANSVTVSTSSLTFTEASKAENAKLTVDGVPIESATNAVSGALNGVTLDLQSAEPNKTITLAVKQDTARVSQAINSFVSSFNTMITAINTQFAYNQASGTAGTLSGDSSVRGVQQSLLQQTSYSSKTCGNIGSLASVGITMNDDGTLTVDSNKLDAALHSDFENVKKFFQGDGTTGFAVQFSNVLGNLTDSTDGPLVVDLRGNTQTQKTLTEQINDFEVQVEFKRQQWLDQFSRVDAILRQFPLTQSQVTSQLDALKNLK